MLQLTQKLKLFFTRAMDFLLHLFILISIINMSTGAYFGKLWAKILVGSLVCWVLLTICHLFGIMFSFATNKKPNYVINNSRSNTNKN